ncbi:protein-(glutamine-N5) methyltransferase, release factor-specific [Chryseobacterium artocarpi]|uniref:peptide chain release factor N(5)-glutamine methyltransferase n=1 Tax=Chryseobacterium artocarpi TaxID=1414727 RepID=A0A1B9A104_9FLAO|nr:peptide chain release factor N(5)-glutamine methyltransferase [Chryseobacterium artocarpi]OCA77492.1 protein-(glutamine-N5) methyltransferase, release factor-specific [Chryseobacterium artocarpi]
MTIAELKKNFSTHLSDVYTESENAFIFQMFAEHILELNNIQQRQSANEDVSSENEEKFNQIISELKTGKPYLQILGETEFYGMKFFVDENVLIPRPETEELLEIAIREIKKLQDLKATNGTLKILDIGTGSGVIPLVLKKFFPNADVSSIDFSEKALKTAQRNAEYHQLEIKFIHADYLNFELTDHYDVIISNPPYIGIEEEIEIADSVKEFEPKMALFSPTSDALIFYRKIAEDSRDHLHDNGLLFLEINQKLGPETLELYHYFSDSQLLKDLSENDRFIFGRK